MPICAYPGSRPTSTVAPPMMLTVSRNATFRPVLSPMRPKTIAPNGRTANPAPNVANALSTWAVGSPGKKTGARNVASTA